MMQELESDSKENAEDRDSFDDDDEEFKPSSARAERWAPIGAVSSPSIHPNDPDAGATAELERLRQLEEEQEHLNSSLLALTTHFAQVQFRLQQIGMAQPEEKERLLQELEAFAFKGCPDIMDVKKSRTWHSNDPGTSTVEHEMVMQKQRAKQIQLIGQLKDQLEDLERFAYETGEGGLPSSEVMEKQKVILDQLRDRMDLDLGKFDQLSHEDLQQQVDQALKRLINPMKVKEQLVQQLKTQITDLERFIEFLQGEGGLPPGAKCSCDPRSPESKNLCLVHNRLKAQILSSKLAQRARSKSLSHASDFLQTYILAYLGCQSQKFQKNQMKKTSKGNHWGDLRASLELAVEEVLTVAQRHQSTEQPPTLNPYNSDDEEVDDVFNKCSEEVVTVVRKELAPALRNLLQHGMLQPRSTAAGSGLGKLGCLPARSAPSPAPTALAIHAWDIFVQYYDMKHGREFSDAPTRKLSQSFNLDSIGGKAVTSKQLLLSTIDNILTTHTKLRRSPDAMFKAFVSAALNHKKLVAWLRMILRVREVMEDNYAPWSYVARTGFEDALAVLDKLNHFSFCLPVDLAVRPFQHIKDAF